MKYSATTTLNMLSLPSGGRSLLCISPSFIGGAMVLVRSIMNDMDIDILEPATAINPPHGDYDLVSLVPLQIRWILSENASLLDRFQHVLIGGASLSPEIEQQLIGRSGNYLITYGMTETSSHVAVRQPGSPMFRGVGDVQFEVDTDDCLRIKGTVTDGNWLQTHDLVTLRSTAQFELRGRNDLVINSGGMKIHPEMVEHQLSKYIEEPFIITSIPDQALGERVVLIVEGDSRPMDIGQWIRKKFEQPKQVFFVPKLAYTDSGKINRKASKSIILSV